MSEKIYEGLWSDTTFSHLEPIEEDPLVGSFYSIQGELNCFSLSINTDLSTGEDNLKIYDNLDNTLIIEPSGWLGIYGEDYTYVINKKYKDNFDGKIETVYDYAVYIWDQLEKQFLEDSSNSAYTNYDDFIVDKNAALLEAKTEELTSEIVYTKEKYINFYFNENKDLVFVYTFTDNTTKGIKITYDKSPPLTFKLRSEKPKITAILSGIALLIILIVYFKMGGASAGFLFLVLGILIALYYFNY